MSGYICFELQIEIIKRLPLKSLVRFKTVSKPWKSLIDSSEFMADYKHHQEPLVLISYVYQSDIKYISLLDDENFRQHKFYTRFPSSSLYTIGCSSHGLFCFPGDDDYCGPETAVIWNPLIRKTVTIDVPKEIGYVTRRRILGFGVCPISLDPMIDKITHSKIEEYGSSCREISVFTLSSRYWKALCSNLPCNNIQFTDSCVAIDGFIYWGAYKTTTIYHDYTILLISFDMRTQEFKEIFLIDSLANIMPEYFSISKLRESVVVLVYHEAVAKRRVCDVWMMTMDDHNGAPNTVTKLYTIKLTDDTSVKKVLGFTNTGAPLIEKQDDYGSAIVVYDIDSQQMSEIGVYGERYSFAVNSYKETLVMLNQPGSISLYEDDDY